MVNLFEPDVNVLQSDSSPRAPPMTFLQALIIAILQGATELFPVSSLGHAVIAPRLLGWTLDQKAPEFLPFLVVLHLGTAAALLIYFWRDWLGFACRSRTQPGRGCPYRTPHLRASLHRHAACRGHRFRARTCSAWIFWIPCSRRSFFSS